MKVEASGRLAALSRGHPDATFRILTSLSSEEGHTTLVEIENLDRNVVVESLEDDPAVLSYDVLQTGEQTTVMQFLQNSEPAAGQAGKASGNPPPYPLILRGGWIYAETTTTHNRLSEFNERLDSMDVRYELLSVRQSSDPTELLTDRQREFVTEALERGYYDSRRRCTLTELADAVNVNKATASGILHRAEGAIIKEFMDEILDE